MSNERLGERAHLPLMRASLLLSTRLCLRGGLLCREDGKHGSTQPTGETRDEKSWVAAEVALALVWARAPLQGTVLTFNVYLELTFPLSAVTPSLGRSNR